FSGPSDALARQAVRLRDGRIEVGADGQEAARVGLLDLDPPGKKAPDGRGQRLDLGVPALLRDQSRSYFDLLADLQLALDQRPAQHAAAEFGRGRAGPV